MNIANLNFENHEEQKPLCMIAQGLLPVSTLYQTKTHEGTTTRTILSITSNPLYQTKTHEGTTTPRYRRRWA